LIDGLEAGGCLEKFASRAQVINSSPQGQSGFLTLVLHDGAGQRFTKQACGMVGTKQERKL
jgi:hypothetical protein